VNDPKPWPWRPRSGYPSVPAWLFLLLVVAAVLAFVAVLVILSSVGQPVDTPGG